MSVKSLLQARITGYPNLREPATPDLDLNLEKSFPIMDSKHLQFRADAFNFTNSLFFPPPDDTYTDGPPTRRADREWTGFGMVKFDEYNFARIISFR
jgi:hypothetical protein